MSHVPSLLPLPQTCQLAVEKRKPRIAAFLILPHSETLGPPARAHALKTGGSEELAEAIAGNQVRRERHMSSGVQMTSARSRGRCSDMWTWSPAEVPAAAGKGLSLSPRALLAEVLAPAPASPRCLWYP